MRAEATRAAESAALVAGSTLQSPIESNEGGQGGGNVSAQALAAANASADALDALDSKISAYGQVRSDP